MKEKFQENIKLWIADVSGKEVDNTDDIFELGLLDSVQVIELVLHIGTLGYSMDLSQVELDNLRTIDKIASMFFSEN